MRSGLQGDSDIWGWDGGMPWYGEPVTHLVFFLYSVVVFALFFTEVILLKKARDHDDHDTKRNRLDQSAKVTLAAYGVTFTTRVAIWVLILSGADKGTGSRVLEFLVTFCGQFAVLAIYHFIFEMKASEIIIKSPSFEAFKAKTSRIRSLKIGVLSVSFLLDLSIQFINQI